MNIIMILPLLYLIMIFVVLILLIIVLIGCVKRMYFTHNDQETMKVKQSLGTVIKNNRIRCHMTQEFVAEKMNVSRQTISKWETGINEPSTSNLFKLAKLFHITPEEMLSEIHIEE